MTGAWTTRDPLATRVAATPDRTAVVDTDHDRSWTFGAFDGVVAGVADRLGEGGPVGLLLGTRTAFAALVHAAFRLDRRLVLLNPDLDAGTLSDQADRAGVTALVCEADTEALAAAVGEAAASVTGVASVDPPRRDGTGSAQPTETTAVDPAERDPGGTALVLFTSGSTGRPKGVRLTLENLLASAAASAFRLGVAPGDRYLCCLPMYHMGGFAPVVRTALYGTTLVVQPTFEAERTIAALAEQDITGVSLVPTQLKRLLDAGWSPPASLETVLVGGAPAAPALVERALDAGVPVHPTYGATEAASQIATATPAQVRDHPDTVGQPLFGTRVTVLADGEPAEPGETGELVVSGPTVTPGYLDAAATAAATDEHGFHTGDLGYRDGAGRLFVEGRLDDAITTGGETVHPAEVVDALESHDGVAEAAVVGLPDEEWGERVAALVAPVDPDEPPTEAALAAFCRERLPPYAVPKTLAVGAVPRTASGTVDRAAVRERLRR
jgi:O-succinylbenzoic acid--CoA ligase